MRLVWRYITFYKIRSFIIISALVVIIMTPLVSSSLGTGLVEKVSERGQKTPLLVTRRGGKIKETLSALFFLKRESKQNLLYKDFLEIEESDYRGSSVPLFVKYYSNQSPVVGTHLEYFEFRNMTFLKGHSFSYPGDVVVGFEVAKRKNLKIGDEIKLDVSNPYDLTRLKGISLVIKGILNKKNNSDDSTFFTGLQTIWAMEGFLHGHEKDDPFVEKLDGKTVFSKSLKLSQDFSTYHYHGDQSQLPITHILFRGEKHKDETLLKYKINSSISKMAYRPIESVDELIKAFLNIKGIFHRYHIFWSLSSLILIFMIFTFIYQIRKEEFKTLFVIGGGPFIIFKNLGLLFISYFLIALFFSLIFFKPLVLFIRMAL